MAGLNQSSMLMFDKEDEKINEVCLVVEDRKFWCSKRHLSLHSGYFCSRFNRDSPEASMKQITLHDPEDARDFHLFLLIINGLRPFEEFDDEAVTRVLALSKQWSAKVVTGVCLEHLLKSEKSTVKEKYFLAELYKLEDYREQIIDNIKSKDELDSILPADPTGLDESTKNKMFLKSLELHGIQRSAEPAPNPLAFYLSPHELRYFHREEEMRKSESLTRRERSESPEEIARRRVAKRRAQRGDDSGLKEGESERQRFRADGEDSREVAQRRRYQAAQERRVRMRMAHDPHYLRADQ
ncbi:unnamed protein product [Caenorhabditis brenneri]